MEDGGNGPAADEGSGEGDTGTGEDQPESDPKLCPHHRSHTKEVCGYVPADDTTEGSPCTYKCQYCPIEALIDALPEDVTDENKVDVRAKIDEIDKLIEGMAEIDRENISNYSTYEAINEKLYKLEQGLKDYAASVEIKGSSEPPIEVETLAEAFMGNYDGATVYLMRDVVLDSMITIPGSFTLDLGEWNITSSVPYCFSLLAGSKLTVQASGSGSITTSNGVFQVNNGGTLKIGGGTYKGGSNYYEIIKVNNGGVAVIHDGTFDAGSYEAVREENGSVSIEGGTFTGKVLCTVGALSISGGTFNNIEVRTTGGTVKGILGKKDGNPCAYYLNGELLTDVESHLEGIEASGVVSSYVLTGDIEVKECTHDYQIVQNEDGATHTRTCPACGTEETGSHVVTDEANPVCEVCQAQIIAKMVKQDGTTEYLTKLRETKYAPPEQVYGSSYNNATLILLQNVNIGKNHIYIEGADPFTLDLNGHTLSSSDAKGVVWIEYGSLTLKDSSGKDGKIEGTDAGIWLAQSNNAVLNMESGTVSGGSTGITVNPYSELYISGGTVFGTDRGLYVEGVSGNIQLTGGTFQGGIECSSKSEVKLADLLGVKDGKKCAYYRKKEPIIPTADDPSGLRFEGLDIIVLPCAHEGYLEDKGDGTHGGTSDGKCAACGTEVKEPHVWDDASNPTACTVCGGKVIAKMEKGGTTEYLTKLLETADNDLAYDKSYDGATLTLLRDVDMGENHIYLNGVTGGSTFSFTLDLNDHTLSSAHRGGVVQIDICNFTLKDDSAGKTGRIDGKEIGIQINGQNCILNMEGGTVSGGGQSFDSAAIQVAGGSRVNISSGVVASDKGNGLYILDSYTPATIQLTGGTFQGDIICRSGSKVTLADMLGVKDGQKCAYYRDGKPISPKGDNNGSGLSFSGVNGEITVKECKHEYQLLDLGDGTHTGTCDGCGKEFPVEDHVLDKNGNCTICLVKAIAKIEKEGEPTRYFAEQEEGVSIPLEYGKGDDGATLTLLQDVDLGEEYIKTDGGFNDNRFSFILDLNGHTLTSSNTDGVVQIGICDFTLMDSKGGGKIAGETTEGKGIRLMNGTSAALNMTGGTVSGGYGIEVNFDSTLNISDGTVVGNAYDGVGLYVKGAGKIQLTGGTFQGVYYSIQSAVELADLLGEKDGQKCAYYRDRKPIAPNADDAENGRYFSSGKGDITVQPCAHEGHFTDLGDGTHGGTCAACGTEVTAQLHDWDETGTVPVCKGCGAEAAATLNDKYITRMQLKTEYGMESDNATLKLLQDVNLGDAPLTITDPITFTLDLNGHELSSSAAGTVNTGKGTFTITDSAKGGGKMTGKRAVVFGGGTLNIEGGTLEGSEYPLSIDTGGTVNITGGTFTGGSGVLIQGGSEEMTVNISGGTIDSLLIKKSDSSDAKSAAVRLTGGTFTSINCYADSGNTLKTILAANHAYFQGDAPVINLTDTSSQITNVTVGKCEHPESVQEYVYQGINAENKHEHKQVCLACGREEEDRCVLDNTEDAKPVDEKYHTSACPFCKHEVKNKDHVFSGTSRKSEDGLTTYYYERCNWCGYEKEPYGTITTSEKEITLTYGETAQMSVDAAFDGIDSYTYQWTLDGANISEESTYSLPTDLAAGEHTYICRATIGGNIYRNDFKVTVNPKTITDDMVTIPPVRYNGLEQKPVVDELTEGTDFTMSWNREDFTNAGTIILTITGKGNYTGTITKTYTIEPAEPTLTWDTLSQTVTYNGKPAGITPPTVTLVNNEAYEGTIDYSHKAEGSESFVSGLPVGAGKYTVKASIPAQKNYTAAENQQLLNLTVEKAVLAPKEGALDVVNDLEHTYSYGLGALRPDVPEGMSLGSSAVTYTLGTVSLGGYYSGSGAAIDGQTLTLPIQAVKSKEVKEIGTVTVIIHTDNFKDMTATIRVRSVNKILPEGEPRLSAEALTYGQALKEISLAGTMWDSKNNKDVPGTFAWSSPENRPAAQESYSAAWTFTPDNNDAYAIVTGTVGIRVNPAPIANAVITLEPAAFRHDGEPHRPEITSVKLGDILLEENVDFIAEIPSGSEPGSYTVTITGKGNYTGTATVEFKINPVEPQKPLDQKDDDGNDLRLEIETGLSTVPDGLTGTEFNTPTAIENELRLQVTENLSGVKEDQIAVYDVRLQYRIGNDDWIDVTPDNFPADGVTAVLPYPEGTNGTNYTFTVQHMISHGEDAGKVEPLTPTLISEGLQCTFRSLSPVAIGYKAKEKTPAPSTPSTPGTLFTDSDSDDDEEEAPDPEYDFWQRVREQIKKAKSGDTVKVNARGYDRMPASVMDALKKSNNVTLRIRWSGGEEIVIPSAKALSELLRIYYPLSYLAKYDFGEPAVPEALDHLNPATGGDIEIEAPLTAEAPLDTAGEPLVTDARRGLAETEEQAEKGIEKAIPGVYQPETEAVAPVATVESQPTQPEADRGGILPLVLALVAAAICGGVWVWKNKLRKSK